MPMNSNPDKEKKGCILINVSEEGRRFRDKIRKKKKVKQKSVCLCIKQRDALDDDGKEEEKERQV